MKHICTVEFEDYTFGVSVDYSIDCPGFYRLVCDDPRADEDPEIADGYETPEEAINAIGILYSAYPIEWEYEWENWGD